MNDRIRKVYSLGQSIWYDNIQRGLVERGEMEEMIRSGKIYGVTSNPSIFQKAIAETSEYDDAIRPMAWAGISSEEIFYQLAIEDIQHAADLFMGLYDETGGKDGFVSLEVNPLLANDTEGTISEARELWKRVNRPNLMVKIPATIAGLPAIRQAISEGININVTLIFSVDRYRQVIEAYISGLEDRVARGLTINQIASVASFFVSRVDTKIDQKLASLVTAGNLAESTAGKLSGKAGLANSRMAYSVFLAEFHGVRFETLAKLGAQVQRPLWASTSTKNPEYPDVLYVDGLIAPQTVNTVPPQTLSAFADHGNAAPGFDPHANDSQNHFIKLQEIGIEIHKVTTELENEGVEAFSKSYRDLLQTIEQRCQSFSQELGKLLQPVRQRLDEHEKQATIKRLFEQDPALWSSEEKAPTEISNRLGWLDLPEESCGLVSDLDHFYQGCLNSGITTVVLLGMGGSSLAAEVISATLRDTSDTKAGSIRLIVLDSTDPLQIRSIEDQIQFEQVLFLVSSKSGTTSETLALMEYFWQQTENRLGNAAGSHFIAITDPDTPLTVIARERKFRQFFLSNPEVGGRFSALSVFGLLPARLAGVNVSQFLDIAQKSRLACSPESNAYRNPGLALGTILAVAAKIGMDKLTFIADSEIVTFGDWAEQLIAESSGKSGKGILPIVNEPHFSSSLYTQDRLFLYLRYSGEQDSFIAKLSALGHAIVHLDFTGFYQLAAWFYTFEIATAIACADLGVNAFNQPDVQDNKNRTKQKIQLLKSGQPLDMGRSSASNEWMTVYNNPPTPAKTDPHDVLGLMETFFQKIKPDDYLAINAFVPRNEQTTSLLQDLRTRITQSHSIPVASGFGPRFLHSTGQLHKGGPNTGHYLVITYESSDELAIPDMGIRFADLINAQALGDIEALQARNRNVLHLHIADYEQLNRLSELFQD